MKNAYTGKYDRLRRTLRDMGRVLIAYSGGVDSTFLLAVAARELGPRGVLAVTAVSETYPSSELTAAKSLAKKLGAAHTIIRTAELRNPVFSANPPDRCFHCKDELFGKLTRLARRRHMTLVDANNYSDRGDYRPGRRAALKWGVRSPLDESRMTKEDIRAGSRALGLPTWNAPAQACLASRIPYGTELSAAILRRIEAGEAQLRRAGFVVFRLRHHGDVARIEVAPGELKKFGKPAVRNAVVRALKRLGWRFVSVDLEGYRCGSLNPPRARAGA